MEIAIAVILGIVAIICFLGGLNLLTKGAGYFLPRELPPQIVLDNVVRFLAGIYFGFAFLLAWVVTRISQIYSLVFFLGIIVLCSGLGRLYSRIKTGAGTRYLVSMMWLEIGLGLTLIVLEYFR